jgi:hypothetical protein
VVVAGRGVIWWDAIAQDKEMNEDGDVDIKKDSG